jgi:hypothetical protein
MKTCPQCGASVPEKKAFCIECGGTMKPPRAKTKKPSSEATATTILPGNRKAGSGQQQQGDEPESSRPPRALSIYWKKRKRMDE